MEFLIRKVSWWCFTGSGYHGEQHNIVWARAGDKNVFFLFCPQASVCARGIANEQCFTFASNKYVTRPCKMLNTSNMDIMGMGLGYILNGK